MASRVFGCMKRLYTKEKNLAQIAQALQGALVGKKTFGNKPTVVSVEGLMAKLEAWDRTARVTLQFNNPEALGILSKYFGIEMHADLVKPGLDWEWATDDDSSSSYYSREWSVVWYKPEGSVVKHSPINDKGLAKFHLFNPFRKFSVVDFSLIPRDRSLRIQLEQETRVLKDFIDHPNENTLFQLRNVFGSSTRADLSKSPPSLVLGEQEIPVSQNTIPWLKIGMVID